MPSIEELVRGYAKWLSDKTTIQELRNGWTEVTTPFLDRNNDHIQLYMKKDGDAITITDDGFTLSDLELSGCGISSPRRKVLMEETLNGFGVALNSKTSAIETRATEKDFSFKKNSMIQAIISVGDLFYTARTNVISLFLEEVQTWLEQNRIRYLPNVTFIGQTHYSHRFDFVIPKSEKAPERIIRAINNPNRSTAEAFAFSWHDIRTARPPQSVAIAILNDDKAKGELQRILEALGAYEIGALRWSEREERVGMLAA
jgi:hypothetical protein